MALCASYAEKRRTDGMKAGTIWTELGWLRTALLWAARPAKGLIPHAPDIARPQKPAPRNRFLTRGEIRKLIDAATAPHIALAIILMVMNFRGSAALYAAVFAHLAQYPRRHKFAEQGST